MRMIKRAFLITLALALSFAVSGQRLMGGGQQRQMDQSEPKEYEIGGITVSGAQHFDPKAIILFTGLSVGDRITVPGDDISDAIRKLWKENLFSDIRITAPEVRENTIFLNIQVQERPRLSKFRFKGISSSDADDLREKIDLIRGKVITENLLVETKNKIRDFYTEDGYYDATINIRREADSTQKNSVILLIDIDEGERIKIDEIIFHGNEEISNFLLHWAMKDTKEKHWYRFFSTSKFIEDKYEDDKQKVIAKYREKGFRDASIVKDSVYRNDEKTLNVEIWIEEGDKYYFGDITWVGNKKYTDRQLSRVLGIQKGDIFNESVLNSRLNMNQSGQDVSSLYMDDGYLFFQVTPVEVQVRNDTIDFEMQIYEGEQARVDEVTVNGNTKTNDHVILREIRTRPGDLFDRSDVIRTQRELSQLGYFDPEKMGVNPVPNPEEGTVDIEYTVAEKPSDQIELSGGWGAGRIVGTLGLKFTNFSARNLFDLSEWQPLPSGDGQQLTVRAQSNGLRYQSYNFSFTEPWLGGKKPNSFSISAYHSVQSNRTSFTSEGTPSSSLRITGGSIGLGTRLKWPDDYFVLRHDLNYQHYDLENYGAFIFPTGNANDLSYSVTLSRNSIDQPIYPRRGSEVKLSAKATPPYSLFDGVEDYAGMSDQEKFRWVEYHKWKFTSSWYTRLIGDMVLKAKTGFGFLGSYNAHLTSPFERFYMGGSGLTGFNLLGREIIALRGYDDNSLSASTGGTMLTKYTVELRYPLSLNPQATIFGLGFVEAGNSWDDPQEFDPFSVKRSAGVGLRIFLPMFGLMGVDYGWRFDDVEGAPDMQGSQFHFTIGKNLGEL